ncbi:MAG TPA: hypothetical protein VHX62_17225 [Solirubrobacteraceae bacterium]|nr:hypothetical protein [Solirubrobacteraceae bacterium]
MPRLDLQFDVADLAGYAARFPSEVDALILPVGRAARDRGYYTRTEFLAACRWKTPRSGPLVVRNSAGRVRRATGIALRDGSSETARMTALRALDGVAWATASVLLHLAYLERYPIIDVRALHALGIPRRVTVTDALWLEFVEAYRGLIAASGLDGRTVDHGLWQWSAEQA